MNDPCVRYRECIMDESAAELGDRERAELARHVEQCAACSAERTRVRALFAELRALPDEDPPRDIAGDVMQRLPGRLGPFAAFRALAPVWKSAVAAGLVVVAALAVGTALRLQVAARDGALIIGFGAPRVTESAVDAQASWLAAAREADARLAADLEARIVESEDVLRRGVSVAMAGMYSELEQERRDDLSLIGQLLVDGRRRDEVHGTKDELILTTLVEMSQTIFEREGESIDDGI